MAKIEDIKNVLENKQNNCKNLDGIENSIFSMSFIVLRIAGFWKPTSFKMPFNVFYEFYTLFCLISIVMLMVTIIIDNTMSQKSIRAIIENMYLLLTIANGISKLINLYFRRPRIIRLLHMYMNKRWTVLRGNEEIKIVEESIAAER